MKVNNRWLYCELTFLALTLLITGTNGADGDRIDDEYMTGQYADRTRFMKNRSCSKHLFKWDDNRLYEGNYNKDTRIFTCYDADIRANVSPNKVYLANCAFRVGDKVACYWKSTSTWLNPGKVMEVGLGYSKIHFDDGDKTWMPNKDIHGLVATFDNQNPRVQPQSAPARKRNCRTGDECDFLLGWNANRIYEGNYNSASKKFTAHDNDLRTNVTYAEAFKVGQIFQVGDRVAAYWTKKEKGTFDDRWLNPGKVTKRCYAFSKVEFDDRSDSWVPNCRIHRDPRPFYA